VQLLTPPVFLDHDNSVKLGDFGLSKILQSHDFASTYVGTPFYMSPEICKAEQYGPHSDIWALGCIVYELCAKTPPFNAKSHFELIQKIKAGRYPAIPSCYSPELNKVIASCLQVFPTNRPDTAQLLNLPIVKLMRKEQEVVIVGHELRDMKEKLARQERELEARYSSMRKDLNDQLRREWEVKAQLEIERRVKMEVERRVQIEFRQLQERFEAEVKTHVDKALKKYPARPSTSPRMKPRSSTPTMPEEPIPEETGLLFPSSTENTMIASTSTLGTNSDFSSATDLSSLSLDDSTVDDVTITAKPAAAAPPKRRTRAPLARAQTMAVPMHMQAPPSPMDIQMSEPSPAPASLAGLSLSPRRNQPRNNIFAAAKTGAKKWEGETPPSPTEADWNADPDEDDIPTPPSPTVRARSASGTCTASTDPFKSLATANKPILRPTRGLMAAPPLAVPSQKPRPASAVPIMSTSPSRRNMRVTPSESSSPVRRTAAAQTAENSGPLKSKKGNDAFRRQIMQNNGVRGRTLVELAQARNVPGSSDDEGKRGVMRTGFRSPVKVKLGGAVMSDVANWDPDVEGDMMPSPFIKRQTKMMIR
jgi:serine/threonine protein kinase